MIGIRLTALTVLAAALLPLSVRAQITFERTYGGTSSDCSYSVQNTADSGYVIAGRTNSFGAGNADVYLVRTDARGDTFWTRTYGGSENDEGWSVQQTFDGGYVVAGFTSSFGAGVEDIYLVKTDAAGDTQWTRTYGGADNEEGYSVEQTADSGFIIAGSTHSFGQGAFDVYIVRTDAHGDTLWTRTYGGSGEDEGWSVRLTADAGYIVTGYTESYGAGMEDLYLVKLNASGDTLWTRTYGGPEYDYGWVAVQTADGGYAVSGGTRSFGAGGQNVYLAKTDSVGDTLWTKTCGGDSNDYGCGMEVIGDSGFVLTGFTRSSGAGGADVYLLATDSDGDTLWTRTYGGASEDEGYWVLHASDGGYVVAGHTGSFGAGLADVYLIKTDADGNVAVAEPEAGRPRPAPSCLTCEPNPFSKATRIGLRPQASSSKPVTLRIYDAQGRSVRLFSSLFSSPSSLVWDGADDLGRALPSGAYFARLDVGGEHATTRVVLQR